jgi:hypothetical protein
MSVSAIFEVTSRRLMANAFLSAAAWAAEKARVWAVSLAVTNAPDNGIPTDAPPVQL